MASSTVRIVGLGHDLCLQEALKESWDHQTLCDVIFIFPSKSYHPATNVPQQPEILKAHSSVLAAVSPVFKNILSSSLPSEEEIVVLVPDYPQRVFCLALNYIYNGGLQVDSTKFEIGQVLKLLSDFRVKVPDFCYVLLEDQSQETQLSKGTSATHSTTKQQQILRSIVPQINFYSNKRTVARYGNFTKRSSTNLNLPSQPQPKNLSNMSPALDYAAGLRKDAVSLPAPVVGSLNWFSPLPEKAFTVLSSLPKSVANLQPTEDLSTTENVGVYCEPGSSAVSASIYRDEEPDQLPDSEPLCSSTPMKVRFRNKGNPAALPVSTALSVRKPSLLASGLRSATSARTSAKSAEQLILEQKAMEREQRRHDKACRVLRSEQQHHRRLKKKISGLTAKLDKYKCIAYKLLQPSKETLSDEEQDLEKKKTKPKAPPVLVECNICGKSVRKSHFSKHTAIHKPSRSRNFLCEQCGRTFLSAPSLKAHRIRNHPSEDGKTHACPECGKIFKNNHCLTLHIKRHRGEKRYSCDVCQKTFVSVQNLKRHARVHTGERPYKCNLCSKGFTQSTTLNTHMRVHKKYGDYQQFVVTNTTKDGRETFTCEYCSFVAGQLDNLLAHRMIHPEATPALRCLSCSDMFHVHQELREHVDAKHPELLHRCEICGEGYLTKLLLHGHRRKKHMENIRTSNSKAASTSHPFTCRYCDRSFKALANMQVHERSAHTGERPYQCSVCGKTFCGIVGLNSHMEVHSDRRPFKCSVCEKAFRTVFRLKCHLLIHTGERPHSCEICGKAFTMKSNLYMHRKIHTGTQHKCRVCNKILPSRVKLEKHEKTHET